MQTQTVKLSADGTFQQDLYKVRPKNFKDLSALLDFTTDDTLTWKSSNSAVATVSAKGVVKGIKNGTVTITATGAVTGIKATCKLKVCNLKQVALTFDDGPAAHTSRLLDFLEDHPEVKVTFFMVGNRLNTYSTSVKRAAKQGHEMGYHSYSHQMQTSLTNSQIKDDLSKSNKTLKKLTGQEFTLWRTPGGDYNTRVLDCVALPHIMWSVDTRDWSTRNSYSVYTSIVNNASDGAIILLHDLHGTTVDGSIRAIEQLLKGDYEFITVTELLSRDGTPPLPHTNYYRG